MFGQILPCLKLYKKKLKSVKARNGFEKLQLQEKTVKNLITYQCLFIMLLIIAVFDHALIKIP